MSTDCLPSGTSKVAISHGPSGSLCEEALHGDAGKLVYHGPREEILPFFESQHMHCPERKADSDFLQEVTSRKDQKVLTAFAWCMGCCLV